MLVFRKQLQHQGQFCAWVGNPILYPAELSVLVIYTSREKIQAHLLSVLVIYTYRCKIQAHLLSVLVIYTYGMVNTMY